MSAACPRRRGGSSSRWTATLRDAALTGHPLHQVAKPDSRHAGILEQPETYLVGDGFGAAARRKIAACAWSLPPIRTPAAAPPCPPAATAMAAAVAKRRRRCLLQFIVVPLHMAFLDMAEFMRHHADHLQLRGCLDQKAAMHEDHAFGGHKCIIFLIQDHPHVDASGGVAGGLFKGCQHGHEAGLDFGVADHRRRSEGRKTQDSRRHRRGKDPTKRVQLISKAGTSHFGSVPAFGSGV